MKIANRIKIYSLVVFFFSLLTGCLDSEKDFSADVDVIYSTKIINDEIVYSESYYAYGNSAMTNATITIPSGTTLQLDSYSSGYVYAKVPEDDDEYSSSYPTEGVYTFNITTDDGETVQLSDEQNFYGIGFTEIDSMAFYSDYDGFYLKWNVVVGADSYIVCLYDSSDELIFTSNSIDADAPEYNVVSNYYGNWEDTPISGNTYTLQIQSIIYDDDATSTDYYYNVQELSFSDFEITWE